MHIDYKLVMSNRQATHHSKHIRIYKFKHYEHNFMNTQN